MRPFGVSFLFSGYDPHHGFQLYQSDPSGNYSGWKATVIGANNQAGKSLLKNEYGVAKEEGDEMKTGDDEEISMPDTEEALRLAVKVLNKTMDATTASADKMELFAMTLKDGECVHKILSKAETQSIIDAVESETAVKDAVAGDS